MYSARISDMNEQFMGMTPDTNPMDLLAGWTRLNLTVDTLAAKGPSETYGAYSDLESIDLLGELSADDGANKHVLEAMNAYNLSVVNLSVDGLRETIELHRVAAAAELAQQEDQRLFAESPDSGEGDRDGTSGNDALIIPFRSRKRTPTSWFSVAA